jgi:HEAT repeat protein
MGLVSSGYPRALVEIAELLTDSEAPVRSGAVRAIACGNPREAELLLRAKVFSGDEESFVIGECFSGLLTVEPDESLAFVAGYLDDDNEDLAEASALALGESRVEGAVERIRQVFEGVHVPFERRQLLVRAAALHRSEEAFDWLLELVAGRDNRIVEEIVDALAIYRHNEKLARRLRKALGQREDAAALAAFDKHWT